MRRGYLRLLSAAALIAVGAFAGAARADTAPRVDAQGVVIVAPDGTVSASPTAQLPGDASAATTAWQSSDTAPVVQVDSSSSAVTATAPAAGATVTLNGVSVLAGQVKLDTLTVSAQQSSPGQSPTLNLSLSNLTVDGSAVTAPAATDPPLALGDWGTLSTQVQLEGDAAAGIRIDITADHDGLAAGAVIELGRVSFGPLKTDGGGPGGGGTNPGPPPTPTPTTGHHHKHQHQHHGKADHHGKSQKRHHHHHRVAVQHPATLPQLGRGIRADIVRAAAQQIGWPYVWGGESRTEGGFDCSGLVDYAYSAAGHALPGRPTAAVLWQMGIPIAKRNLRPGDLAFLGTYSGEPYHVAMYAGHGMVIVASGRGRPIAAVPLDSVPWDGYARIWADGSLEPPHPLHVVRPIPAVTRADRQADVVAASRALLPLPAGAVPGKPMRALRPAPHRKAPRRPERRSQSAVVVADPRVRPFSARAAGALPSA